MRFELTRAADNDLMWIYVESFRRFGERQADSYLLGLKDCFGRLAGMPGMGRKVRGRSDCLRFEHASHTVFYRRIGDGVRIIRILHARMDPDRQLP